MVNKLLREHGYEPHPELHQMHSLDKLLEFKEHYRGLLEKIKSSGSNNHRHAADRYAVIVRALGTIALKKSGDAEHGKDYRALSQEFEELCREFAKAYEHRTDA